MDNTWKVENLGSAAYLTEGKSGLTLNNGFVSAITSNISLMDSSLRIENTTNANGSLVSFENLVNGTCTFGYERAKGTEIHHITNDKFIYNIDIKTEIGIKFFQYYATTINGSRQKREMTIKNLINKNLYVDILLPSLVEIEGNNFLVYTRKTCFVNAGHEEKVNWYGDGTKPYTGVIMIMWNLLVT